MKTKKMPAPMLALHTCLAERMAGRHILGTGSFNPKVPVKTDIDTFTMLMTFLSESIDKSDWEEAGRIAGHLPLYGQMLTHVRYSGHDRHLANMLAAIEKQSRVRAAIHLARLRKVVHRVAADRVFRDNERVSVMRTRHGWYDGHLQGVIKPGSGGSVVLGDDGWEYEIEHPRDIR